MRQSLIASAVLIWCLFVGGLAQLPGTAEKARAANEAVNAGEYQKAITLYQELIDSMPDVAGLKMNLGLAHYFAGNRNEAARYLQMAVQADANLATGWMFLGLTQLETDQAAEAVSSFEEFVTRQPDDPHGRMLLANALFAAGRFEEAAEQYEKLAETQPENPKSWAGLGRSYEAISGQAFEQLEKLAPESGYWLALIGDSRAAQQQFESAFFFYRKALEKQPKLRGVHIAISRIYRDNDHPDWAVTEEDKEMQLGVPDCQKEFYVCAFLEGRLLDLLRAVKGKGTAEAYYWKSRAANQLAGQAFAKLEAMPPSVEAHQLRAQVHRSQRRYWESVTEMKKALAIEPGNLGLKRELAVSYYQNRDYDAAIELSRELFQNDPESPELNFLIGDSLLYQQQVEEAIPYLERAVKGDPDYLAAQSSLGRAHMHVGEPAKAIPHLKAALPLDEDASLHYQLARAYQRTGDRESAQATMKIYQELKSFMQSEDEKLEEELKITPP
jgi:predicted Zn-dependent protease